MNDHDATGTPSRIDLLARRTELLRRLNDGDQRITDARRTGADTGQWEKHWITLLRDYELVCREIANLDAAQFARAA